MRQHAPTLRQPCANALCADSWSTFAPTRANGVAFLGSQRLENAGKFSVGAFSQRQDNGRKTLCLPPLSYRFLAWKTLDLVLCQGHNCGYTILLMIQFRAIPVAIQYF